ncbi:MAG: YHS domain-containing protein [Planctomycetota bacterium]|jgi:YHS domain-containing protein
MNTSKTETRDPVCGMTVDTATALHAERDGKASTFAASIVGRSFCPPRPAPRWMRSPEAAVASESAANIRKGTRGAGSRPLTNWSRE